MDFGLRATGLPYWRCGSTCWDVVVWRNSGAQRKPLHGSMFGDDLRERESIKQILPRIRALGDGSCGACDPGKGVVAGGARAELAIGDAGSWKAMFACRTNDVSIFGDHRCHPCEQEAGASSPRNVLGALALS